MPAALVLPRIVVSEREAQMAPERETQVPIGWSAQMLQAASGSAAAREKSRAEPRLPPIRGGSAAGTNRAALDPLPGCDRDDRPGANSWYCTCP